MTQAAGAPGWAAFTILVSTLDSQFSHGTVSTVTGAFMALMNRSKVTLLSSDKTGTIKIPFTCRVRQGDYNSGFEGGGSQILGPSHVGKSYGGVGQDRHVIL